MDADQRQVEQRLGDEVAVADGIEGVGERRRRSRAPWPSPPGRAAATSRRARRRRAARRRGARPSRRAGRRRARAPIRGRGGGGRAAPAGPAAGACSRAGSESPASSARASRTSCRATTRRATSQQLALAPQPQVGGDLVVAAAAGVELAAGRAGELGDAALDRGVDVLVARDELERVRRPARARRWSSAAEDLVDLDVRQQPGALQPADVGARAGDVVGPQAPVERQALRVGEQLVGRAALEPAVPERVGRQVRQSPSVVVSRPASRRSAARRARARRRLVGDAQQRVVAGDRAEQPVEPAAVERRGDDVRAARRRAQDDEVGGHGDLATHSPITRRSWSNGTKRSVSSSGIAYTDVAAGHTHLDHARGPRGRARPWPAWP